MWCTARDVYTLVDFHLKLSMSCESLYQSIHLRVIGNSADGVDIEELVELSREVRREVAPLESLFGFLLERITWSVFQPHILHQ